MRKWLIIPPFLLALAVVASSQVRGGFGGGGFGHPGFGHPGFTRPGFVRPGLGNPGFGFPGRFPGGVVIFSGYSDYPAYPDYPSGWAGQPSQPLVVVQSNPSPAPSEPPSEPLMIVWQGDGYVRYGGRAPADRVRAGQDYSESVAAAGRSRAAGRSSASSVFWRWSP